VGSTPSLQPGAFDVDEHLTPIERARRLRELSHLSSEAAMEEFDRHIDALIGNRDPTLFAELFLAFDDQTDAPGEMWRLLQLVEDVPDETYVAALTRALPAMSPRAPEWAARLYGRVVNSDSTRAHYHRLIPTLSPTERATASALLDVLADTYPQLVDRIAPLREQLAIAAR